MAKSKVNDDQRAEIMAIIRRKNLNDWKKESVEMILKELNITIRSKNQLKKFRGKVFSATLAVRKEKD